MRIAWLSRNHPHESVCGDAVAVVEQPGRAVLAVIDGLGHGPDARVAADAARQAILERPELGPGAMLARCHVATRSTRGAAVGIMELHEDGRGVFAGVGNVAVTARSRAPIHLISHAGIVGHQMRTMHEFPFTCSRGDLVCIFSDGLQSGLCLDDVRSMTLQDAAAQLIRQYGRDHDDATVLLVSMT